MKRLSSEYLTMLLSAAQAPPKRIMPATGIRGNREHFAAEIRHQLRSGRQIDGALLANGILRAITLASRRRR